jgi:hypothetical protein
VIIIIIKGISIQTKVRDYIQKSSLELISFMEHTVSVTDLKEFFLDKIFIFRQQIVFLIRLKRNMDLQMKLFM